MGRIMRGLVPVAALSISAVVYIALPGSAGAGGAPLYPNVIEVIPEHLQIQNDHQKEWLRFSTTHLNIGPGNLQIRGGGQVEPCDIEGIHYDQCTVATQEILDSTGRVVETYPAGVAFFHPEHNHWHQSGVAAFAIMQGAATTADGGREITAGFKTTFCFVDVEFSGLTGNMKKAMPRTYFECNGELQGLAAGWADEYHQSTPFQELEVTGLEPGDYYLTHLADPDQHWKEAASTAGAAENDNFSWVKFHLSRDSSNAKVTIIDHSPCTGVQCGFGGNP
jgi:hypothetical protein